LGGFFTVPPFSHGEVELHDDAFTESLGVATLHQLRACRFPMSVGDKSRGC